MTDPVGPETTPMPSQTAAPETAGAPTSTPAPAPAPEASAAAPTAAAPTAVASGASRGRWLVAGGVAVGAIAIAVAALLLLGARPTPEALKYIPGDAAVVAELRLDLPGDQVQKVGNLLAHFPGFKDQSTLGQKIDEALARIADSATSGQVNYAADVKPWLAGPLFVGARPSSGAGSGSGSGASPSPSPVTTIAKQPFVAVATTDGKVTCESLFRDGAPTTENVNGLQVRTSSNGQFACVLDGRYGVLGDPAMVKAALAAHAAHTGVDANAAYRTARDVLGGDRLATVYVTKAAMEAPRALPSSIPALPLPGGLGASATQLPEWAIAGLNAEDDALVADVITAPIPEPSPGSGSPRPTLPPPRASRIAALLPADTVAFVEVHGAGIAATNGIAAIRDDPSFGPALTQLDTSLALIGGADALLGWIEDLGVVVVPDGSGMTGGVLLVAPDDATAAAKADQIRSILSLAGLGGGGNVRDTTIGGTKVTTVDLGDLGALLSLTGQTLPIPAGTTISLSVAARGPAVILGGGEAFARHVLETAAGTALADQAGYKRAIGRAATQTTSLVYVGVTPLLQVGQGAIPEADRPLFTTEIVPYLQPLDAIVVTTTTENGRTHVRFVATVK